MSQSITNLMRREATRVAGQKSLSRAAIVTSYDPNHYAAKVLIQPENYETGFLPIATPWVGPGWGMFCPPSPGDVVDVHFQEGSRDAAFVALRFYGNAAPPLSVPSGEFWLVHKSGSYVKLLNDGTVHINAAGKVIGNATEWDLTGNLVVTGNITATGDIYDQNQAEGSMSHIRTVYDSHTHPAPGGTTGTPNQTL
jgi:hypothetical protein